MKIFLALSIAIAIAVLAAGCTIAPVRYVPVATTAPAQEQAVPAVVYVQPTYYYDPFIGIAGAAAGVLFLRGVRGWHGGHQNQGHHRR